MLLGERPTDACVLGMAEAGMACDDAVRYPVGFQHRHACIAAIAEDEPTDAPRLLNYIESRRRIYLPVYARLLKQHPMFLDLKKRLEAGENLLVPPF